jgi:RNA-directed DNA polymerase
VKCFDVNTKAELAKLLLVSPLEIDNVIANRHRLYRCRQMPKSDRTFRVLRVPTGPLKLLQKKVKDHILDAVALLNCVHGGVAGRSVLTNARPHLRKPVVFTLDLKDFFPSVSVRTVQTIFEVLGFGREAADLLVQITAWDHQLPQGAPTSMGLANLAMTRADVRLKTLAQKQGFDYTRYVDDLALSGPWKLLSFRNLVRRIVEDEGFRVNPNKLRTMHAGMRQTVAGVVVNGKINLPREERKSIRIEALRFASTPVRFRKNHARIRGQLSWLLSVNPPLGVGLRERVGTI